jgi:nitroreductase
MDVIDSIHRRRSIRDFLPNAVPREMIEAVIWDAAQAPPPLSGQVPWTFHVFEGIERIAGLGKRAKQYAKEHHPDEPGWAWTERTDFKVFWDAPVLILISGRVEDCCRAGMILTLSAHARGLGTCWVGAPMLWLRNEAIKRELGLSPELQPASAICLGYARQVPSSQPRQRPIVFWA